MKKENLIPASEICAGHNVEISFIRSLQQNGLIELTTIKTEEYIPADSLNDLEKLIRLHYDMDINMEGIETITHLLKRINSMHDEIRSLKNKLDFYENE